MRVVLNYFLPKVIIQAGLCDLISWRDGDMNDVCGGVGVDSNVV